MELSCSLGRDQTSKSVAERYTITTKADYTTNTRAASYIPCSSECSRSLQLRSAASFCGVNVRIGNAGPQSSSAEALVSTLDAQTGVQAPSATSLCVQPQQRTTSKEPLSIVCLVVFTAIHTWESSRYTYHTHLGIISLSLNSYPAPTAVHQVALWSATISKAQHLRRPFSSFCGRP